jgi:hypothetical protein
MKPFSITFKLDAKILAVIYICFKHKYPLSFLLSFYEMYGEQSLFILKAMSCAGKLKLTDNAFAKLIEESRLLYSQILKGISINIKRNKLISQVKNGKLITEIIPNCPEIDLNDFTDDYKQFITNYLEKNVKDLFKEEIELMLDTTDLYSEIR